MNESCVETGSGKQDVPVSRITTGAGKQAWSIFGVVLSTALIGWLDFLSGWEFSFFPLYAIPIWLAIWVSGLGFGILVALACGVAWWWANEEVHPYTTPWGYPMAAVARWIYFAAVVIAGTAVRRRQIVDAIAIQRLAKLKAKEAELNAVCEHELRFVGRSICGVLRGQMSGLIESLRRLASSKADFRDNELTNQALSNAENLSLELQAIADGIFPPADVSGPNVLYASLKSLVEYKSRTSGIRIELTRESEHVSVNNPLVCMHLYRIAQEALDNVIRHSKAANAWISLQAFYDHLELRVDDDGCGISDAGVPASESGMGVKIMRYRAGALNAYFSLQGRPGGGTSVACRLPCFDSMTRSA